MGLDASFARTGLAVFSARTGRVFLYKLPKKVGKLNYKRAFLWSEDIVCVVKWVLEKHFKAGEEVFIVAETPPPTSQYSSGLSALGVLLAKGIGEVIQKVEAIGVYSTVSPMYIGHIHGTRKYAKADTVEVGKRLLEVLIDREVKIFPGIDAIDLALSSFGGIDESVFIGDDIIHVNGNGVRF